MLLKGLLRQEGGHASRVTKRHRGDSNPCGQSPMDFESISLAARTQCHVLCGFAVCTPSMCLRPTCQPHARLSRRASHGVLGTEIEI